MRKVEWSKLFLLVSVIKMVLEGHRKFGYLTGEIPIRRLGDPHKRIWKGENSLLRSLLIIF